MKKALFIVAVVAFYGYMTAAATASVGSAKSEIASYVKKIDQAAGR